MSPQSERTIFDLLQDYNRSLRNMRAWLDVVEPAENLDWYPIDDGWIMLENVSSGYPGHGLEDYATGLKQQKALQTGARDHVLFGRNEAGGQKFHKWLGRILETSDEDLNDLFRWPPDFD